MSFFGGLFGSKSGDTLFEFKEYSQGFAVSNTDLRNDLNNSYLRAQQSAKQAAQIQQQAAMHSAVMPTRVYREIKSMSDLDHAVFKTPIETLINLWIAKYGNDWVDKETVMDDEFFEYTVLRLRSIGRLEEHTVWDPESPNKYQQGQQPVNNATATAMAWAPSASALSGVGGVGGGAGGAGVGGGAGGSARKTVLRIVDKEH